MSEHELRLPWRNDDPYPDVILDTDGDEVASCSSNEDCDFIVKAVNNHDALVKALERISAIGSKITDPNNLYGIQMTNIAVVAVPRRYPEGSNVDRTAYGGEPGDLVSSPLTPETK